MFKLLLTIALVAAVWFIFKNRSRIAAVHKEVLAAKARDDAKRAGTAAVPKAQDLLPCPKCGAYVAAGAACTCEKI